MDATPSEAQDSLHGSTERSPPALGSSTAVWNAAFPTSHNEVTASLPHLKHQETHPHTPAGRETPPPEPLPSLSSFSFVPTFRCTSCGIEHPSDTILDYLGVMPLYGDEAAIYVCSTCHQSSSSAGPLRPRTIAPPAVATFEYPERRPWIEIAYVALVNLAIVADGTPHPEEGTFHHLQSTVDNFIYANFSTLCFGYTRNCWKSHLAAALNRLPSHFEHAEGQQGKGWWRIRKGSKYPTECEVLQELPSPRLGESPWARSRRPAARDSTFCLDPPSAPRQVSRKRHRLPSSEQSGHVSPGTSSKLSFRDSSPSCLSSSSSSSELYDLSPRSSSSTQSDRRYELEETASLGPVHSLWRQNSEPFLRRETLHPQRKSSVSESRPHLTFGMNEQRTSLEHEWLQLSLLGADAMAFVQRLASSERKNLLLSSTIREYRLMYEAATTLCQMSFVRDDALRIALSEPQTSLTLAEHPSLDFRPYLLPPHLLHLAGPPVTASQPPVPFLTTQAYHHHTLPTIPLAPTSYSFLSSSPM